MITINARNVNDALPQGLNLLRSQGIREESRDGPVLRYPTQVATVYEKPLERVLFASWRDANPVFHLVESCWILAGRDDIKRLTPYVARMSQYSDDGGVTQPAAYGKRWRNWESADKEDRYDFIDQINWSVKRLRANPSDRRVVIQAWDPGLDAMAADMKGKDVPCNITVLPWVSGGCLHLTVICRSNDIVMGAYGANAVQFSFLLEYLAGRIGLPVGTYTQFSNNYHAYLRDLPEEDARRAYEPDPYLCTEHRVRPELYARPYNMFDNFPLASSSENGWTDEKRERICQEDLAMLFEYPPQETQLKARWPWLRQVVCPMMLAHAHWKKTRGEDRYLGALEILNQVAASDWRLAAQQWIQRRHNKWLRAQDDGVQHADVD